MAESYREIATGQLKNIQRLLKTEQKLKTSRVGMQQLSGELTEARLDIDDFRRYQNNATPIEYYALSVENLEYLRSLQCKPVEEEKLTCTIEPKIIEGMIPLVDLATIGRTQPPPTIGESEFENKVAPLLAKYPDTERGRYLDILKIAFSFSQYDPQPSVYYQCSQQALSGLAEELKTKSEFHRFQLLNRFENVTDSEAPVKDLIDQIREAFCVAVGAQPQFPPAIFSRKARTIVRSLKVVVNEVDESQIEQLEINPGAKYDDPRRNLVAVIKVHFRQSVNGGTLVRYGDVCADPPGEFCLENYQNEVVERTQGAPFIRYQKVNRILRPADSHADKRRQLWKVGYEIKLDRYYGSQRNTIFVLDEHKDNEEYLGEGYALSKDYFERLIRLSIEKINKELIEEKLIAAQTQRLNEKTFMAVMYGKVSYDDGTPNCAALNKVEELVHLQAVEHFQGLYIESFSEMINQEILDEVSQSVRGRVKRIQSMHYDDFDIQDDYGTPVLHAVFVFEVSGKEVTTAEARDAEVSVKDNLPGNAGAVGEDRCSTVGVELFDMDIRGITPTNRTTFTFPGEIEAFVKTNLRAATIRNRQVRDEIINIKSDNDQPLAELSFQVRQLDREREALRVERNDFLKNQKPIAEGKKPDPLPARQVVTRESCGVLIAAQNEERTAFGRANAHGQDPKDGYLHFVYFSEKLLGSDDSIDSLYTTIVQEGFVTIFEELQPQYLSDEILMKNFEITSMSLTRTKVQPPSIADLHSVGIILRTHRRTGTVSFFGLGIMFTVRGQVSVEPRDPLYESVPVCVAQSAENGKIYAQMDAASNPDPRILDEFSTDDVLRLEAELRREIVAK